MSIEGDIQFSKKGGGMKIVGLTDVTEESRYIQILKTHKNDVAIATHALQFLFLGVTGFHFPFAHFTTTGAPAYESNYFHTPSLLGKLDIAFNTHLIQEDSTFIFLIPHSASMPTFLCK
jgi:hypothetical protein